MLPAPNRRQFIKGVTAAAAAAVVGVPGLAGTAGAQQAGGRRREVRLGGPSMDGRGRRIKTIDIHTHVYVTEVLPFVEGRPWADFLRGRVKDAPNLYAFHPAGSPATGGPMARERIRWMDEHGSDVQVLATNPWYYFAEREISNKLMSIQNEALAGMCAAFPGRFAALATVTHQHPDLAAQQLEEAFKKFGMRGSVIAGNIGGMELSDPKLDPFWAKAQELESFIFMHPQAEEGGFDGSSYPKEFMGRLAGPGGLGNVVGYPLETTIAFSHLIFGGVLDKFPGLRICGAHGAGFLPSYIGRSDASCLRPGTKCPQLKKRPSEYFREQLFCDSLVFNDAELRLRVDQYGAHQVVLGTDYPAAWPTRVIDHILETEGLTDAEKVAILGGNLTKYLGIPQFEVTQDDLSRRDNPATN